MEIIIEIEGTTPLLQHNPQLSDPEHDVVKEIKALTTKRKKTTDDNKAIARLEWFGGLYVNGGRIVEPTANVRKCLINTAKISKLGRHVERAVSFTEIEVTLKHDGPADTEAMFKNPRFTSRLSVVVGNRRVMRVRPQFFPWKLIVPGIFIEDAGLNYDEFQRIVALAGQVEGIGDNRRNGYGRFIGVLKMTSKNKIAA